MRPKYWISIWEVRRWKQTLSQGYWWLWLNIVAQLIHIDLLTNGYWIPTPSNPKHDSFRNKIITDRANSNEVILDQTDFLFWDDWCPLKERDTWGHTAVTHKEETAWYIHKSKRSKMAGDPRIWERQRVSLGL